MRSPRAEACEWVHRFGGSVSHVAADPSCELFYRRELEGAILYRHGLRCAVGVGDPACRARDWAPLAGAFEEECRRRGWAVVYAAASEAFAHFCVGRGYGAIEFAEELVCDPRRDPRPGRAGRELRKSLYRALRAGVTACEYGGGAPALERELEAAARAWLDGRRGLQAFIAPLRFFAERRGRRWFYARAGGRVVGALSAFRIPARDGWGFEHAVTVPGSPPGTSELLIVTALEALGRDGCGYATFGPSPRSALGRVVGTGRYATSLGRAVFGAAARVLHFAALSRYRRKFRPMRSEGSYLLFLPARFGVFETTGLLRAFHFSLRF